MKISEPKIILLTVAAGFVLLITALVVNYRSYLQEPDAYRQLREKAEASGLYDMPERDPAIISRIDQKYRLFSMLKGTVLYLKLSDLINEIGPAMGYFQFDVNWDTELSVSELNEKLEENLLDKNKFEHYQKPPFAQHQDLHQHLDLLVNKMMVKEDVQTIRKWFLEVYLWGNVSDMIVLAGYRALLQDDPNLSRDCFYLLTDIHIHSIEERQSWYALNHLYREYLWNSMEQGLLTDGELEELRLQFVRTYQEKPKLSQDTKRREQRSSKLFFLAEWTSHDIRSGRMIHSDDGMLSDFLSKLSFYYRRPAAVYYVKEYYSMLDANDLNGIDVAWSNLEGEFSYLYMGPSNVYAIREAYEQPFGIFPEEVIEAMPWVDRDRYKDAELLNCLALIEGYQYKRKQGHYPLGEIFLTDIDDEFSKHKRFFFIEREGHPLNINQKQPETTGMGMGMEGGRIEHAKKLRHPLPPVVSISLPRRVYCVSTTIGNTVVDGSGKSDEYLSSVVFDPDSIPEFKGRAPYTGWWEWSFLTWDETQPIFQEVLIDYPKIDTQDGEP